jgi:hypothetical protein
MGKNMIYSSTFKGLSLSLIITVTDRKSSSVQFVGSGTIREKLPDSSVQEQFSYSI